MFMKGYLSFYLFILLLPNIIHTQKEEAIVSGIAGAAAIFATAAA
jgi:hypothetical protein